MKGRVPDEQDPRLRRVLGQQILQPADLPAPGSFTGAVQKNQPAIARFDTEEVRAEVIVETETAKVLVLVGTEGQQIGDLQVAQSAVECPVLVFAATTDSVPRRNQKIQPGSIQLRDDAVLEDAHRIIDIAHHRETEGLAGFKCLINPFYLLGMNPLEILREQIQVGFVANQQKHHQKTEVKQQLEWVSEDHPALLRLATSSFCSTTSPIIMPR